MSQPDAVDTVLSAYHSHSCHSTQAWIKGMTKPFPCDCDVRDLKARIEALIAEARLDVADEMLEISDTSPEEVLQYLAGLKERKQELTKQLSAGKDGK